MRTKKLLFLLTFCFVLNVASSISVSEEVLNESTCFGDMKMSASGVEMSCDDVLFALSFNNTIPLGTICVDRSASSVSDKCCSTCKSKHLTDSDFEKPRANNQS